jgi:hypothetical protein
MNPQPTCAHDPARYSLTRDPSGSMGWQCRDCGAWAQYLPTARGTRPQGQDRYVIQAWERTHVSDRWTRGTDIAECAYASGVGVALETLTDDGEFHDLRKAAVWDRAELRYLGGPPW